MAIRFFNPDDPLPGKIPQDITPEETAELFAKVKAELDLEQLEKEIEEIKHSLDHPEERETLAQVIQELERSAQEKP